MSAEERPSSRSIWLLVFILVSILVHVLIVLAIIVVALYVPHPKLVAAPAVPPSVTLTLQQPPSQKAVFLPTEPDPKARPENSLIQSDNNNQLHSKNQTARKKDSILPDVTGKQVPFRLQDQPASPPAKPQEAEAATPPAPKSQPTPPKPTTQVAEKTPPPPPQPPSPPTKVPLSNPTQSPPVAQQPFNPNGLPVLPPINAQTLAPQTPATPPVIVQTGRAARPPPSFAMNKSDNAGGVGTPGDNSPSAMQTDLGRYKARVYRAVGARWYAKVGEQLQVLPVGIVHIKYTIYSDGRLEITADPQSNNATVMLLHSISYNSMIEAAPFGPFSEKMKAEVGDSYSDDFSFSIYGG